MTQAGLIHWEIAGGLYIQCHISDSQSVDSPHCGWSPYVNEGFLWCNPETSSQCIVTFVVHDEHVFTKGENRSDLPEKVYVVQMHLAQLMVEKKKLELHGKSL